MTVNKPFLPSKEFSAPPPFFHFHFCHLPLSRVEMCFSHLSSTHPANCGSVFSRLVTCNLRHCCCRWLRLLLPWSLCYCYYLCVRAVLLLGEPLQPDISPENPGPCLSLLRLFVLVYNFWRLELFESNSAIMKTLGFFLGGGP